MSFQNQIIKEYVKLVMQKQFDERKFNYDISSFDKFGVYYFETLNEIQIMVKTKHDKLVGEGDEQETVFSPIYGYDISIYLSHCLSENKMNLDFNAINDVITDLANEIIEGQREFENE